MPRVDFVRSIAPRRLVAFIVALPVVTWSIVVEASAQIPPPLDEALSAAYQGTEYSPYAGRGFPSRVYWGDTHLHTGLSMDAGAFGNRPGLEEAYRFARGDEVTTSGGLQARLSRPLDFLVVADHSDNMGFFPDLLAGKPNILADPTDKDWYERIQAGDGLGVAMELIGLFSQGKYPAALNYAEFRARG